MTERNDQDEEAIRRVVASFADALARHDAHTLSMVFYEDADFTNVWGMCVGSLSWCDSNSRTDPRRTPPASICNTLRPYKLDVA
jgi:hypothetical protein